jgi:hypothetical protein
MREPGESVAQIITDVPKDSKVPDSVASLIVGAMPVTGEEAAFPAAGGKRAYLKAITVEGSAASVRRSRSRSRSALA